MRDFIDRVEQEKIEAVIKKNDIGDKDFSNYKL